MVPVIKNNLEAITAACKEMQVKTLYVIGSAAREIDFQADSDIDFMYTMIPDSEGLPAGNYDYFDLLFKLQEITNRKVDLISESGIRNKYFLQSIIQDKQKVYEA